MDYFKASIHLSQFALLVSLLNHYRIVLPQLVPKAIRMVIAFQLFCDNKRVTFSVPLFRSFFLLKSSGVFGWYIFTSCCPSLKVTTSRKIPNWKDKFFYYSLPFLLKSKPSGTFSFYWINLGCLSLIPLGLRTLRELGLSNLNGKFEEVTLVWAGLS